MGRLRARIERLSVYCAVAAGACLLGIVVLTTLNIIFRRTTFLPPIMGTEEGSAFLGALVIALALPFTQVKKAHICVEMLEPYLSPRTKVILARVNAILSAIMCLLIAWQSVVYGFSLRDSEEVSMTLAIPFYPIIFVMSACFVLLALVFITDMSASSHHAAPPEGSV